MRLASWERPALGAWGSRQIWFCVKNIILWASGAQRQPKQELGWVEKEGVGRVVPTVRGGGAHAQLPLLGITCLGAGHAEVLLLCLHQQRV